MLTTWRIAMKKRKAWLSRQRDGNYMFTFLKPVLHNILGTNVSDFYIQPGEPIGVRHWCPGGVKTFFGVELQIGEQVRVWATAGIVGEKDEKDE